MERDKLIELLENSSEQEMILIENYFLDKILKRLDTVDLEDLVNRAVDKKLKETNRTAENWISELGKLTNDEINKRYTDYTSTTNPAWIYNPPITCSDSISDLTCKIDTISTCSDGTYTCTLKG